MIYHDVITLLELGEHRISTKIGTFFFVPMILMRHYLLLWDNRTLSMKAFLPATGS